jgi:chaperone modulatory protein CbpM
MTRKDLDILQGMLLDDACELSLGELARACSVHSELIIEMVQEGIVEPRGASPEQWRFVGSELPRIERALRLHRDLEINLAGIALVLDLLDELQILRRRVARLEPPFED